MKRQIFRPIAIILIISTALLCGCSNTSTAHRKTSVDQPTPAPSGSTALAVITMIDTVSKNISFDMVETTESEMYSYNGGTLVYSRSNVAMSVAQLKPGDIVDITFDASNYRLKKIQISGAEGVWENTKVTSFNIDESTHSFRIGQSLYSYDDDLVVASGDKLITVMELNSMDQLIVRGYNQKVVSVVVSKGHGYVTLDGDGLFLGGLVNVGGLIARNIEKDMLLIVTEGTYKLEVTNGKYYAEKFVTVTRDEESVVDFSDVAAEINETGNVKFNINVSNAVLYIDGVETDYASIVTLPTGTHKVVVEADGYNTYSENMKVSVTYEVKDITLTAESETTTTASESETTSAVTGETKVSTTTDVTVQGPAGGSIYFDGVYKGIAPVTFDLVTGSHVISVLYDNKITSYSVNLIDGADPVTYDFTPKE